MRNWTKRAESQLNQRSTFRSSAAQHGDRGWWYITFFKNAERECCIFTTKLVNPVVTHLLTMNSNMQRPTVYTDCKALWYMLSASNFVYQLKTKFPQFLPQLSHWLTAWPEASHWSSLGVSWLPVKQDNGAAPAGSCKHRVMVCEALWFTHKRGCKKANHRSALQASANYFLNKKRWIFYPSRRYRRSLMVSRWGR